MAQSRAAVKVLSTFIILGLVARAYREAGVEAVEGFRQVLMGMIDAPDRKRFERRGDEKPAAPRGRVRTGSD